MTEDLGELEVVHVTFPDGWGIIIVKPKDVELDGSLLTEMFLDSRDGFGLCYYTDGTTYARFRCWVSDKESLVIRDLGKGETLVTDRSDVAMLTSTVGEEGVSKVLKALKEGRIRKMTL